MTAPQSSAFSDERRRHRRQRVSSIIYVKLADGNGGILLNLGPGGLAFQAVAGLRPEQDVVLDFSLIDTNETITVMGHVAWLGPTRKEVGIYFRDLAPNSEQSIARWMGDFEMTPGSAESNVAPPVNPAPMVSETPAPPAHASVMSISRSSIVSDPPSRRAPLPSDSLLGNAPPKRPSPKPSAPLAFEASFQSSIPSPVLHPKELWAESTMNPTAVRPEPLQPIFHVEPANPSKPSKEPLLPDFPRADVVRDSSGHRDESVPVGKFSWSTIIQLLSSLTVKQRRQALIVSALAACLGILVLILIAASFGANSEDAGSTSASVSGLSVSPAAVGPGSAVTTTMPRRVKQSWLTSFENVFVGADDNEALDSSTVGIAVWTDTKSGFYYCLDSPYFAKMQPGSLVAQGEALQSGYQPKLGRVCQ